MDTPGVVELRGAMRLGTTLIISALAPGASGVSGTLISLAPVAVGRLVDLRFGTGTPEKLETPSVVLCFCRGRGGTCGIGSLLGSLTFYGREIVLQRLAFESWH